MTRPRLEAERKRRTIGIWQPRGRPNLVCTIHPNRSNVGPPQVAAGAGAAVYRGRPGRTAG
jgi:hypothetical protein